MSMDKESLFSLELVVEKLYVPHVQCRFPAVAFRLLDFPTILIEHVEDDLGNKIKQKISRDPYYTVPDQFIELKDKHGNFMIKKGKSCLFKMTVSNLKTHLSNTPLYVMVLDNFPKVSKLIGNCTVPLDEVMVSIENDIKTMGNSVPSVHGDKGLYKIFSLMGKEIGYVIMGYRLLCLGPGLIPHIPETAIAKPVSKQHKISEEQIKPQHAQKVQSVRIENVPRSKREEKNLNSSHDMGSMTEPEMCDALIQTLEFADKEIHVAMTEPVLKTEIEDDRLKNLQTTSTQTHDRRKQKQKGFKEGDLILQLQGSDSEDDILPNNIDQPPPLFFNSKAEPKKQTKRVYAFDNDIGDDQSSIYTAEISDDDTAEDEIQLPQGKRENEHYLRENFQQNLRQLQLRNEKLNPEKNVKEKIPHHVMNNKLPLPNFENGPIFPILTALLNEISKIQNPQLVQEAAQKVQMASRSKQDLQKQSDSKITRVSSKPVISSKAKLASQSKADEESKENFDDNQDQDTSYYGSKRRGRKSHKACAHPHDGVPKQKSWIRNVPEVGVRKSKLTYGLTNTQRLRLAKVNPNWMKLVDKDEVNAKKQRQKPQQKVEDDMFDTGNMSDTLTEVRRLAQKSLDETAMDDTLLSTTNKPTLRSQRRQISPPRRHGRKRSRSPKVRKGGNKDKTKTVHRPAETNELTLPEHESDISDNDTPSSRSQKSIQVRIPSAQIYGEETDGDSDHEEVLKNQENKMKQKATRFAGFGGNDDNLLDTIDAAGDDSFNVSEDYDYDQPLESTRNSKPNQTPQKKELQAADSIGSNDSYRYNEESFESDVSPRPQEKVKRKNNEERMFQSTEDYDTHQFQSTDEPELQRLISSGERSQLSDVLSSPTRSAKSPVPLTASLTSARFPVLNPKASLNSPIPALRRSQVKLDTSLTRPSPSGSPRGQGRPSPTGTPRSQTSSRFPTPKPRKAMKEKRLEFKHESIHTESVSSYQPSDYENTNPSMESGSYSDDFSTLSGTDNSAKLGFPRLIPSTKLGYTA